MPYSRTLALLTLFLGLGSTVFAQPSAPPGFQVTPVLAGPSIEDLHGIVATVDERLLVTHGSGGPGTQELLEIDLVTGASTTLISGLPLGHPDRMLLGDGSPLLGDDLILADHNTMETADCCDGRVFRVDLDTLAVTEIAAGNPVHPVGDPFGLARGLGGGFGEHLYVMDFQGASANAPVLYRVLPDGTADVFVTGDPNWTTAASPKDIAFDPSGAYGGDLFVADEGTGDRVWRVTPSGVVSSFVAFVRPTAIAFGPGGASPFGDALYVLDHSGLDSTIFIVAPDGSTELFATGLRSATGAVPDLAFAPDGRTLFVAIADEIVAIQAEPSFRRGDCNVDGSFDIADAVALLAALFSGGALPTCDDACDVNDDGGVDISDAVSALSSLFSGGGAPATPFMTCGADPTPDALGCATFDACP